MSQNLHFRTDFKIFEISPQDASYTFLVPFRFSYYTTGDKVFVASHNNGEYANCELLKDGRLKIAFENHGLAPGRVMCIREFFLTDEDYSDGICNVRITTATDIYLTMNGGDVGDISVQLPPFYQKGDKGDPFTWSDMTPEQREYFIEQVGADVVATNEALIEAEAARASSWENLSSAINSAIGSAYAASSEANKAAANARDAANDVGEKGDYAKGQGDYAKEQASEAYSQSVNANSAARQARDEANQAKDKGDIAEQQGNIAEGKGFIAEQQGNIAEGKGNEAKTKGDIAEQQGISAAEAAAAANKAQKDFGDWFALVVEEENSRQEQETIRELNESRRINLENNRIELERLRGEAETERQEAESERKTAESKREDNEAVRGTQETQRQKQEDGRVAAENAREEAESKRQKDTSAAILNAHQAADSANEAAESANEARESIQNDLAKKADIDKFYPKMTVGFAQDIVGDGSATPEEFSFRPTAGEDRNVANTTYYDGERNGVARIEKVKGNSVGWNQKMTHLRPTYVDENGKTTYIDSFPITINGITFNRNIDGSYSVKGTATAQAQIRFENPTSLSIRGHKYYVHGFDSSSNYFLFFGALSPGLRDFLGIFTQASADAKFNFAIRVYEGATVDDTAHLYAVDLTQMFGAGNEPTTIEEFYQRLPKGVDINAFNEGEIVNGNYGAIKTVGFNAFNGTYAKVCAGCPYHLGGNYTSLGFTTEEGGTTEAITLPTSTESVGTTPSDRLYTPTQNGYIYAEGENININLSWDTEYGYLNGTYQPYKPFERDLSWVNKYFPATINGENKYGMRSAGSARDEIRFNSTTQKWEAVQNVGVRAYAEGDAEDASVTTDGTNTNYALGTPIVTEIIEDVNLDFDVSDFGTEELIVAEGAQSAPLVADIAYAPNALNTLKQVPDILKRLKALESALAQQTTNVEPSNIEE